MAGPPDGPAHPRPHSLTSDLSFELGEDRNHRRHSTAGWRGQVESLRQGNEGDVELLQLLESQLGHFPSSVECLPYRCSFSLTI